MNKMRTLGVLCLLSLFVAISATSNSSFNHCVRQSQATFFSNPQKLQLGACGYGALAPSFRNGHIAAIPPSLYAGGLHCGACFKIRCKDQGLCREEGTVVIATDRSRQNGTEFVLSSKAFKAMANKGMAKNLSRLGTVDVEYRRVRCNYKGNLTIRVEESSVKPNYLAIQFLNLGGQTEILVVSYARAGFVDWTPMSTNSKSAGAVFHSHPLLDVPTGPLVFQLGLAGKDQFDVRWRRTPTPMPGNWSIGGLYDTGMRIADVSGDGC